jgi:hypothetical protein
MTSKSVVVCKDCLDFTVDTGMTPTVSRLYTSDGLDFLGCKHISFIWTPQTEIINGAE